MISDEVSDLDRLRAAVEAAQGSPRQLRTLFVDLRDRLGSDQASQLWWRAFSPLDAAET